MAWRHMYKRKFPSNGVLYIRLRISPRAGLFHIISGLSKAVVIGPNASRVVFTRLGPSNFITFATHGIFPYPPL